MYIFLPQYLKSLDISKLFFSWSHRVWKDTVWLLLWSTHNSMFCPFTLQAPRITLMWLKLSWISYHKWVIIALGIFTLRIKYHGMKNPDMLAVLVFCLITILFSWYFQLKVLKKSKAILTTEQCVVQMKSLFHSGIRYNHLIPKYRFSVLIWHSDIDLV